ncbi:tyrosine-type recombinase/integrase [Clostridium sp. HMP27]|uniref:tyrosine-type recombinase/integrase n=1 Tax=Clostridium sp. HMP27 TaxID=1487921 RepID=UPI00052C2E78|nr:tyrosine-type recombinase/integrase [Clostridium sp. HMP27]KGK87998.1 integrase [Clostridium sp. HMP27]
MQGSVRKKGNKWYYSFEVPGEGGKRKRIERSGGNTKKEALEALNEAMYKYMNGFVEPKKLTYDEYMNDWLENFVKENRKINTYERYKEIYKNNIKPYIGKYLLKDLKPLFVEKLLQNEKKKGLSNSTVEAIYGVINTSLNRAVRLQIINDNVCKFVERPRRDKFKANTLTIDEFNLLLSDLNKNIYGDYIFKLALMTTMELGLRRGELGGLEWENIDFENNLVNIKNNLIYTNNSVELGTPKTEESERAIYISDELLEQLKKHKKVQALNKLHYGCLYEKNFFNNKEFDFVFTWEGGKFIHPNYYTLKFSRLIKRMGIEKKIRFHDLRHTNATLLLQQGIDFKVIQTRLGHSDINTTLNIYSHVTTDMQKSATEKLSNLLTYTK